jgi:predicted TIM-barrel fold metal-dependent hydrolase
VQITDAQIHIWAADRPDRPWPAEGKSYAHLGGREFGKDEVLAAMDAAGVDRAVLVPPSFEGDYNDLAIAAAQQHPDRFAVMGRLPLDRPDGPEALDALLAQPGVLGVRQIFSRRNMQQWLRDGTADWFWQEADRRGIPVMVFPPGELDAIAGVAASHPKLRLVIDHLAISTGLRDDAIDPEIDAVNRLAKFANVAVKASSMPSYVTEPYPFPSLHNKIRRVVDAFGRERVFWGSDLSRLTCPYRQCVTLFTEELDFLSDDDREWIMGRGISEWLGW